MHKVSREYKKSMKSSLRERSYMMISFGLINQDAQLNATVEGDNFAYFSKQTDLFGQRDDTIVYGTLEQDFTKVDGSMYFLPRKNNSNNYYDTGLVGAPLVTEVGYELLIEFNVVATDVKGLTINFGEIYPTRFDIVGSTGQVIEVFDNDKSVFITEDVITQTTFIRLIFYKMKNPNTRLRIYSIQFGIGLIYYNDSIMDSQLDAYISPICENVPQIDFMVKLKNYDHYFNVDNPNSAIHFLETGQEMYVWYGYQLPESGNIEWMQGAKLWCSEWESDDYSATIRCQDLFRNMDGEYYKGSYRPDGINYFDLATLIFEDAGIEEYYIDPYLKKLSTKNPMPRVKHKEALQIIANACRCVLSQNRYGRPQIKSSFTPEYEFSCNGETPYSNLKNIRSSENKEEYASYAKNYSTVTAEMRNVPEEMEESSCYTGYVSLQQSDENGLFTENPIITVTQETACMYYGLKIVFGAALPAGIIFRTFDDGTLVDEYEVTSDITKYLTIYHEFDDFDVMEIEFTRTAEPYNRIVVNHFTFGDITDFKMEKRDMMTSPKAIKQELIKSVQVPCYFYQKGTPEETLISEETETVAGEIQTYFIGDPTYDCRATLDGSESGVNIIEFGDYYITVEFLDSGTHQFEIIGHKYNIVEQYATNELNSRGKTVKWENPLISDMETASNLAEWIGDYYNAGIEYEYDSRGNPEMDANDVIYQENAYVEDMKVKVYRHTTIFNGALSGKVVARRTVHNSG